MTRTSRKRGGKAAKCGLSNEQIPVLICRGRTGNTADFVLEKADKVQSGPCSNRSWRAMPILCTDSGKALGAVARRCSSTESRKR